MARAKSGSIPIPFVRSAASEEIAKHREALRSQVISDVFEKWGLDVEGRPFDSRWDKVAKEQALQSASEEIATRLEELGLQL